MALSLGVAKMPEPENTHISFDSGSSFESTRVTPLDSSTYRLEETPASSELASFGDVIEVEKDKDGRLLFRNIVLKAELKNYRWLLSRKVIESPEFKVFCENVLLLGGTWESLAGGYVVVHIPRNNDFNPETEIERIVKVVKARP
jgi:hypothetical protein